jgi:hypothetical protein
MIDAQVKSSTAAAFNSESASWLALQHGARIVGGTLLMTDPDAPAQLVPGPCILMEYRNRGLGSLLLCSALRHLRDGGMTPRLRQNPRELAGRALFCIRSSAANHRSSSRCLRRSMAILAGGPAGTLPAVSVMNV